MAKIFIISRSAELTILGCLCVLPIYALHDVKKMWLNTAECQIERLPEEPFIRDKIY